jgi:hypothetical protein
MKPQDIKYGQRYRIGRRYKHQNLAGKIGKMEIKFGSGLNLVGLTLEENGHLCAVPPEFLYEVSESMCDYPHTMHPTITTRMSSENPTFGAPVEALSRPVGAPVFILNGVHALPATIYDRGAWEVLFRAMWTFDLTHCVIRWNECDVDRLELAPTRRFVTGQIGSISWVASLGVQV